MRTVHFNLSQLELVVALVETGSFSGAAKRLSLTQSAASHALARLETELGALLVERGKRGVTLTPAGERVLQHARGALSHIEAIRGVASGEQVGGRLRLGLVSPLPARLVAGVAGAFKSAHPGVELHLGDLPPGELAAWLEEGRLDVGLVCSILEAEDAKTKKAKTEGALQVRPLLRDEMRVVVAGGHKWSGRASVARDELTGESLIVPYANLGLIGVLRGKTGRAGLRHLMSDAATMLAATRVGLGATLLPSLALDEPLLTELVALPLEPPLLLEVGLAARSWDAASGAALAFAALAHNWAHESGFG